MNAAGRVAVILPAAGRSSRFGGEVKKPFLPLAGRPVWVHSAALFARHPDVCQVLLVVAADDREALGACLAGEANRLGITLAPGGEERRDSVANALGSLMPEAEYVAVHDAARPCVTAELIDRVFAAARARGAAVPAVPVADTIKRAGADGRVEETVARQGLWLAQTPQVFRRDWLLAGYAGPAGRAGAITDDAQLVEAAGHAICLVAGSAANFKITTPEDLRLAEAVLRCRA